MNPIKTLLILIASLGVLGCSDSPTGPGSEPIYFSGTLSSLGSETFFFDTAEDVIRVTLTELTPILVDVTGGLSIPEPSVGFSLGEVSENSCVATFVDSMSVGDSFAFELFRTGYFCVILYDSGAFLADSTYQFTLVVDP
ncbi:MAG: hypothetical protein MPN21_04895 [Thermoanaerobaculia bacterium]|nr:hypothetical protein [Thermoanaerobaculia bacterium]